MLFKIFLVLAAFLGVINAIMQWPLNQEAKSFAFHLFMKLISIFVALTALLLLFGILIT